MQLQKRIKTPQIVQKEKVVSETASDEEEVVYKNSSSDLDLEQYKDEDLTRLQV